MEDFRSKSYSKVRMQVENTNGNDYNSHPYDTWAAQQYRMDSNPGGMQDMRCYNTFFASSSVQNNGQMDIVVAGVASSGGDPWKFKKGKSTNGVVSKNWEFSDPELQRKNSAANYKAYTIQGKVKYSIKKSFRWIKETYAQVVYGRRYWIDKSYVTIYHSTWMIAFSGS